MNLDQLRRVQGKERRSDDLHDISEDFYRKASGYIEDLEKREKKDSKVLDELKNSKRALRGVFDRRLNKILKLVAASLEVDIDLEPMTPDERRLFAELKASLKQHKKRVFNFDGSSKKDNREKEDKKENKSKEIKVVKVLEDLEEFVGTDGLNYNLQKNDVVALPKPSANVLLKKGAAEEIK